MSDREGGPDPEAAAAEPCLVPGCGAPSVRRLALTEARKAFAQLPERGRRAPLCRDHYREWKKTTKAARRLDRLGR
ncbi:MAG TPA: hypothetical protein VEL82_07260 [Thermoplasmata archaeon]|nr:hypothetical protein [Thermoplasmata archaeon]